MAVRHLETAVYLCNIVRLCEMAVVEAWLCVSMPPVCFCQVFVSETFYGQTHGFAATMFLPLPCFRRKSGFVDDAGAVSFASGVLSPCNGRQKGEIGGILSWIISDFPL
jgi:hypothetical protein